MKNDFLKLFPPFKIPILKTWIQEPNLQLLPQVGGISEIYVHSQKQPEPSLELEAA